MRKDIKKRLEKALITLQEPGGSTIRSIIKVINKDSPVLSLRKVLEALQDGINEGFLCMYNGRFKLKQQIYTGKGYRDADVFDSDESPPEEKCSEDVRMTSESDSIEDTDVESEEDDIEDMGNRRREYRRKSPRRFHIQEARGSKKPLRKTHVSSRRRKRDRQSSKKGGKSRRKHNKTDHRRPQSKRLPEEEPPTDGDSLLELKSNFSEKKSTANKSTADKFDVKKQRGPRCTSMKKDVRMPSKVHIPFVPPSVPQRSSTFNDLIRRSPEPVNGPLFDDSPFASENLPFPGIYC